MANGLSEAAGLGTTFVLASAGASVIEAEPDVGGILGVAALAVLLGTFLEGCVVGAAQGTVLQARRPDISRRSWVGATSAGAGLAWLVGMVPSTAMALAEPASTDAPMQEPTLVILLLLAALLGLVTGPVLGVAQWVVLRRRVARPASWLWANGLAWAVGMPVIFAGMDLVPWDGPAALRIAAIYSVCLVAGLMVGAIHGAVLVRITR